MKRRLLTLIPIFLLAFSPVASAADTAAELFVAGRTLIEKNCGDCSRGTRDGLLRGIQTVKQALAEGFSDEVAAYKALATGYNTAALVFALPDSEEQQFFRARQEDAFKRLLEIAPEDAGVRLEYAEFLAEPASRIEHLQAAVKLAPRSPHAKFALAAALIQTGKADDALPVARAAIALAERDHVEPIGDRLGALLEGAGRAREAALLRNDVQRRIK